VDIARSIENPKLEQDAIVLYEALAGIERDPHRAAAFRLIAGNERRHAGIWEQRLRELGAEVPPPGPPRARIRLIIVLARLFGTRAVSDLVKSLEGDEEAVYDAQAATPEIEGIAADEREHLEIWRRLDDTNGKTPARRTRAAAAVSTGAHPTVGAPGVRTPEQIALAERWHRNARSGTFRAVVFGVSDGLVSNLALVMGVAGASGQGQFILMAGIAGLLAGAFSMAAGEYISMQSQRELFERQIALERAEMEAMPEEEERELAAVFMAKGLPRADAQRVASHLMQDPEQALDTLVREELGLDPDELGSPWGAAAGSFTAFGAGAVVPVLPYLLTDGTAAFLGALGLSLAALFAVGVAVSLVTGRSALYSGTRQLGIGAGAAAITFLVGTIIGVGVNG
jgi:vacuolar iron transporter family protein